jgi:hypothetical protein
MPSTAASWVVVTVMSATLSFVGIQKPPPFGKTLWKITAKLLYKA